MSQAEKIANEDLVVVTDAALTPLLNDGRSLADALERQPPSGALAKAIQRFHAARDRIREDYFPSGDPIAPEAIVALREPEGECACLIRENRLAAEELNARLDEGARIDPELAERMAWRRFEQAPAGYGGPVFVVGRRALDRLLGSAQGLTDACWRHLDRAAPQGSTSKEARNIAQNLQAAIERFRGRHANAEDFASPEAWVAADRGESAVFAMRAELAEVRDTLSLLEAGHNERRAPDKDSGPAPG